MNEEQQEQYNSDIARAVERIRRAVDWGNDPMEALRDTDIEGEHSQEQIARDVLAVISEQLSKALRESQQHQRETVHAKHDLRRTVEDKQQAERGEKLATSFLRLELGRYEQEPKLTATDETLKPFWTRTRRMASLMGYREDFERLARELELELDEYNPPSSDSEVSTNEEAEALRERATRDGVNSMPYHPSDPRLSLVWEQAWQSAKDADLCTVFEAMAERLCIPTPEMSWSHDLTLTIGDDWGGLSVGTTYESDNRFFDVDEMDESEKVDLFIEAFEEEHGERSLKEIVEHLGVTASND